MLSWKLPRLLTVQQVPKVFHEDSIICGYRSPRSSALACVLSLFQMTNETLNIWTHFIPSWYFLWRMMSILISPGSLYDPFMWPLLIYLLSCCIYPLMSTFAHTFSIMSTQARHICFFLDYGALSLYSLGSGVAYSAYVFPERWVNSSFHHYFVPWAVFNTIISTGISCYSRFPEETRPRLSKVLRTTAFAYPYLFDSIPLFYRGQKRHCARGKMSRAVRDQYERRYHVTETRTNPKGFTEYKVIAEFIPKKDPQDAKEIVVWKRYSDFKKLHGELSYTHRNLFQRTQEFPAFPKAQVFGRFEAPVIEERRQAAEDMLRFTVNIPALNNSPQLKEFFRTGEVTVRSNGPDATETLVLPPPLIPEPARSSSLEIKEVTNDSDVTESAEAAEHIVDISSKEQTEFDVLFGLNEDLCCIEDEDIQDPLPSTSTLTANDLAIFDPCYSEEGTSGESETSLHLLSLKCDGGELPSVGEEDGGIYLSQATSEVQRAMELELAGNYPEAFRLFRNAVDILLKGVKDDHCPERREAVTRRTAEYLHHAEKIFQEHMDGSLSDEHKKSP